MSWRVASSIAPGQAILRVIATVHALSENSTESEGRRRGARCEVKGGAWGVGASVDRDPRPGCDAMATVRRPSTFQAVSARQRAPAARGCASEQCAEGQRGAIAEPILPRHSSIHVHTVFFTTIFNRSSETSQPIKSTNPDPLPNTPKPISAPLYRLNREHLPRFSKKQKRETTRGAPQS